MPLSYFTILFYSIFNMENFKLSYGYPNSSITEDDIAKLRSFTIVNCVINACSSFTAAFGNSAIMFVIWRTPALHSPSLTLLFGLALTDFFVGSLTQPLQVVWSVFYLGSEKGGPRALKDTFDVLSVILSSASFSTATIISVDRYLVFHLHMRYPMIVTNRKVIIIITLSWLMSGLLGFLWAQSTTVYYLVVILAFAISLFVVVLMYSRIYSVVKRHQAQINTQAQVQTRQHVSSQMHFARWSRSAVNTFYVCFFLFLFYFPYICTAIVIQLTDYSVNKYIALQFTGTITFINSSLNPLVYFWRVAEIRIAIKDTFKCRCPVRGYETQIIQRESVTGTSRG